MEEYVERVPGGIRVYRFPGSVRSQGRLIVPSGVTLPDGRAMPEGEYEVVVFESLFKLIGRPPGSLGFWPGPTINVRRVTQPGVITPRGFFSFRTMTEALVIYDIPGWEAERREILATAPDFAPYIRNRELIAIVWRGTPYYLSEAVPELERRRR